MDTQELKRLYYSTNNVEEKARILNLMLSESPIVDQEAVEGNTVTDAGEELKPKKKVIRKINKIK